MKSVPPLPFRAVKVLATLSQKIYNICDEKEMIIMPERPKYQNLIYNRIKSWDEGYVFSTADFIDIADAKTVNRALERLHSDGTIRKILQGIYDLPIYNQLLEEYMVPQINSVADCLARKYHWTIAPAGDTALNQLHISTQVTAVFEYVSDGPYREYAIGNRKLRFKHVMSKEIIGYQPVTIMVIQAIRAIGKDNMTDDTIEQFKSVLTDQDKKIILKEGITSADWIRKIIRRICEDS